MNINKEQFKKNCPKKENISKKLSEQAKYYLDRIKSTYRIKSSCKDTIKLTNLLLPLYKTDKVYSYRGTANFLCANYKESIKDYNLAININNENPLYFINLVKSKEMMKDYSGALKDINSAIKLDSTQSIYFRERGLIKNKLGDYLGSLSDLQKALTIPKLICYKKYGRCDYKEDQSYKSNLYKEIGKVRIKLKDYIKAISSLNKSISLSGIASNFYTNSRRKLPEAFLYRGIAKYELKDYKSACSDWYFRKSVGFFTTKYISDPAILKSVKHNGSSIYSLYKKYC